MPRYNQKIVRLSLPQQLLLADFIKLNYADKKLTDTEFAVLAAENLTFRLNDNHVSAVRNALGIPSTQEAIKAQKPETIIERLETCEKAIGNLIRRMDAWEK